MADLKRTGIELDLSPEERKRLFPYPEKSQTTPSGEVFIESKDLLADPLVADEIRSVLKFVRDKKLIKKK